MCKTENGQLFDQLYVLLNPNNRNFYLQRYSSPLKLRLISIPKYEPLILIRGSYFGVFIPEYYKVFMLLR